jgi:hypothetical protein
LSTVAICVVDGTRHRVGGTTQFIIQWLLGVSGNPILPDSYTAALLVGGIAMTMIPKSAPGEFPASKRTAERALRCPQWCVKVSAASLPHQYRLSHFEYRSASGIGVIVS